jgi:hypothetical protein
MGRRNMMLNSNDYKRIEPYVRQWAEANGHGFANRAAQFDAYVDGVVAPFIKEMYAPMLSTDVSEQARVLVALSDKAKVDIMIGDELLKVNVDGGSTGRQVTDSLVHLANSPGGFVNGPPPSTLNSAMSPQAFMDGATDDWVDSAKKFPGKVFRIFGETATQRGMRQPAYIDIFKREKTARLALGMTDEAATEMAHVYAGELINNIYFNTKSATPMLQSMNNVIPFFTAMWEITSTWAYKIPMMQGGLRYGGAGYINLIRKTDRITDALRELGLIEFDEKGQPKAVLDAGEDRWTRAGPGDEISWLGAQALRQPSRLIDHILNVGHAVRNKDVDISDALTDWDRTATQIPDKYEFSVSSPVDFQSVGIGTAFDLALGAQPPLAAATSWARDNIPALSFVSSTLTVKAEGSLEEFAAEHSVDVSRTVALNLPAIREHLGRDVFRQFMNGDIEATDLDLSGLDLQVANSSIWSTLWDDVFNPYGATTSMSDVASSYKPSWLDYAWRGFGIWRDGNEADGFVGIDQTSVTNASTNGVILSAARHYNAETGGFEQADRLRAEFQELAAPYLETGVAQMQNGTLTWIGEKPANVDEVNDAWDTLTMFEDAMWTRIVEDGASSLMMRGMLGFVLPGTPRAFFEEERKVDAYYQGAHSGTEFRRVNIDEVVKYLLEAAVEDKGGSAYHMFLANNPDLRLYLNSKSFWGAGGAPPLENDIEQYHQDLQDGLIKPMPIGAWKVRDQIRTNEHDRHMAIREEYGPDPHVAAAMSLSDPLGYSELTQPFTQTHIMIMWEDEIREGEYLGWKDRNREDQFSIREESIRKYNDTAQTLSDTIQMLEITPLLNAGERQETIRSLKQMKVGLNEFIEEMRAADQNYDFLAPWQQLRMRWFEEGYVPFLEARTELFDKFEDANTAVEEDRIWAEIAELNDTMGAASVIIDGREFPSPKDFEWNNKDLEVRETDVMKSATYKIDWLDPVTIDRLLLESPELEKYLPSTPAQQEIWDDYNEWYATIDERWNEGQGEITLKERNKQRENLEGQLHQALLEGGYSDQVTWSNLWAIQKLNEAGMLPETLQDSGFVEMTNSIQQRRAAEGYASVGDDDAGRRALTREIMVELERNPQFRADLVGIGLQLYGEELPEAIIPILFFNDRF